MISSEDATINKITNKIMSVMTIIALCVIVGFSANNLMAQVVDCDNICPGSWGPWQFKSVVAPEDGFCVVFLNYRKKQCEDDDCTFEIDIRSFSISCPNPYFLDMILNSEALMRAYGIAAFRALVDDIGVPVGCPFAEYKTTFLGKCVSLCTFEYTYDLARLNEETDEWEVADEDKDLKAAIMYWDHCDGEGCCIRTRKVFRNGTTTETLESSPNSKCDPDSYPKPPSNASCFETRNSIEGYINNPPTQPYTSTKQIFKGVSPIIEQKPCNSTCY